MKFKHPILVTICGLLLTACQTTNKPQDHSKDDVTEASPKPETSYVFGWGEVDNSIATPRGGTSKGSPVTYTEPRQLPLASIAEAETSFEKDRAAILALAGDYKAGFHFLETLGLFPEHEIARPYHSWATEKVLVIEDSGEFISLQHILVMYFVRDNGSVSEPMVMKHWRQDWTYQDADFHTFHGSRTWGRDTRSSDSVAGTWSQSVWQVDDSPRYEAIGAWSHDGDRSMWTGENTWRPLPRRERSVRTDYDVMEGFHRIIISPTGWMHEQNNWKRVAGETELNPSYRGHEIGLDRYELVTSPSLSAAEDYWSRTHEYWADVREAWQSVYRKHDRFSLRDKVDDKSQFQRHFEYAGKLNDGEDYEPSEAKSFAKDTVELYLITE